MTNRTVKWDEEDALLAANIFGTADIVAIHAMIEDWIAEQCGKRGGVTSIELSIGAAIGITLDDGLKIFLKVWPGDIDVPALTAQVHLQTVMAQKGYPAPLPRGDLVPLGKAVALLMEYDRSGQPTDVRIPGVRDAMARGLARFVKEAHQFRSLPDLPKKELLSDGKLWPKPHSVLFDFEATAPGAEWIDEIALDALETMRNAGSEIVVGHHDWSAKNMRMGETEIAVVYDWDAVFLNRETFLLGGAVSHFPVTWELPVPKTPTRQEMSSFLKVYQEERGHPFSKDERAEIIASISYSRAYTARCEHALDTGGKKLNGSTREVLKENPFRVFDLSSSAL